MLDWRSFVINQLWKKFFRHGYRRNEFLHESGHNHWQWQALSEKPKGHIRTYVLAFIAVERLIHRGGFPATMDYVKSANFKKSFPFSWEDFKTDVERYHSSVTPANNAAGIVMQKPDWKVGDQWTHGVKHPGDEPLTTKKIVREDTFKGKPSYVIRVEERELFYSKETLERLGAMKEGKLTSERYDASHDFSWPLTLGKQWKNAYTWENFANRRKHKIDYSMVVSEVEKVTVPAGTFLAAKIQGYDSSSGRLMWEYWYSPTTKWLVKSRDYSDIAFREETLTSFKIN